MGSIVKKRIGFFGGTFDPIHFGHLNLAIHIKEHFHLDEVLFSPSVCNPFKIKTPPKANAKHRLEMVRLATLDVDAFKTTDIEIEKNISYTVDALKEISEKNRELYLILSDEAANGFFDWRESEIILKLCKLLIGTRKGECNADHFPEISESKLLSIPILEISSTQIRERLKKKLYCGHLVPHNVLKYIKKYNLYQS